MATRKTPKRTTSSSTRRRTTRTTRTGRNASSTRRRSRPGLPTTIGAALGTLAVTTLLDLSWPARIGLLVVVVLVGLGYVVWRHRAEITAASAEPDAAPTPPTPPTPPTAPSG